MKLIAFTTKKNVHVRKAIFVTEILIRSKIFQLFIILFITGLRFENVCFKVLRNLHDFKGNFDKISLENEAMNRHEKNPRIKSIRESRLIKAQTVVRVWLRVDYDPNQTD